MLLFSEASKIEISKYMAKKFPEVPKDNEGNPIHDKFKEVMKNTTATNLDAQKALIDNMSFTDYFQFLAVITMSLIALQSCLRKNKYPGEYIFLFLVMAQ